MILSMLPDIDISRDEAYHSVKIGRELNRKLAIIISVVLAYI